MNERESASDLLQHVRPRLYDGGRGGGGARDAGADAQLYQVAELVPDEALERTGAKAARQTFAHLPAAKPEQMTEADAIIFGTPTRFGNMGAQMRNFLDQTGQLWFKGAWSAKWAACLPPRPPSTAARRPPSPAFTPPCFTTG